MDPSTPDTHNVEVCATGGEKDPDAINATDPAFMSDVAKDMYARDRVLETVDPPDPEYLRRHPGLTAEIRERIVSYMSETHLRLRLRNDTLFWAVGLFDRYLSRRKSSASEREARVSGCAALYVASKMDELYPLEPEDVSYDYHADSKGVQSCSNEELVRAEAELLRTVGWDVAFPTALHFLRRCSMASNADDEMHWTGKYALDLFVHDVRSLRFRPSVAGAAAAYLARRMCGVAPAWTDVMQRYSGGLHETDLLECAGLMYDLHRNGAVRSEPIRLVVTKYARMTCGNVSGNKTVVVF